MVDSPITIELIYLDCTKQVVLTGGVATLEDDSSTLTGDGRTVSTTERSDRVKRSWQLSWNTSSDFIMNLYEVVRTSKGFLFVSPLLSERSATGQRLRNTVTGLTTGDGTTKTFQLQRAVTLSLDIGVGSASSDLFDVNYPLVGTVIGYVAGVSAPLSNVDLSTGIITFSTAPTAGAAMTADYEQAFPAKFTSMSVGRSMVEISNTEVRSAQVEEIF